MAVLRKRLQRKQVDVVAEVLLLDLVHPDHSAHAVLDEVALREVDGPEAKAGLGELCVGKRGINGISELLEHVEVGLRGLGGVELAAVVDAVLVERSADVEVFVCHFFASFLAAACCARRTSGERAHYSRARTCGEKFTSVHFVFSFQFAVQVDSKCPCD